MHGQIKFEPDQANKHTGICEGSQECVAPLSRRLQTCAAAGSLNSLSSAAGWRRSPGQSGRR